MKIKDLLFTYQNKYNELNKTAEYYFNTHYCGYMGEGSESEWNKLRKDVEDYLESEVEL